MNWQQVLVIEIVYILVASTAPTMNPKTWNQAQRISATTAVPKKKLDIRWLKRQNVDFCQKCLFTTSKIMMFFENLHIFHKLNLLFRCLEGWYQPVFSPVVWWWWANHATLRKPQSRTNKSKETRILTRQNDKKHSNNLFQRNFEDLSLKTLRKKSMPV